MRATLAAPRKTAPAEESGTLVTLSPDIVVPDHLQGKEQVLVVGCASTPPAASYQLEDGAAVVWL
jgi:hypothetical protein